jgi:hypothetical protein
VLGTTPDNKGIIAWRCKMNFQQEKPVDS